MNIKQMALVNTLKIIGVAVLAAVTVNLAIFYMSITTVGIILGLVLFGYFIKFAYDIELSKLESKNALNKLKETK
jgi:Flp pilus assembly protein TadB